MARLKQLEPKKETIGGLNFYIRPFPAMIAANLTGDLASLLTPVLAALMPLVGNVVMKMRATEKMAVCWMLM